MTLEEIFEEVQHCRRYSYDGAEIAEWRMKRRFRSRRALADKAGLRFRDVVDIESQKRLPLDHLTVERLAETLRVGVDLLFHPVHKSWRVSESGRSLLQQRFSNDDLQSIFGVTRHRLKKVLSGSMMFSNPSKIMEQLSVD